MSAKNLHVRNWETQEASQGRFIIPCCMTCQQLRISEAYYVKSVSAM